MKRQSIMSAVRSIAVSGVLAACLVQPSFCRQRVACIGNSITYGTSLADPATESYPSVLQKLLGREFEVGNFGKPGATLLERGHRPYVMQREWTGAKDFKADIAVIHLGINDTDPRDWPLYGDDFVTDYLKIIDTLRRINPRVRVLVARMTPIRDTHPRFSSGTIQWHGQIQKAIATVAEVSGADLIDFYEPLNIHPEFYNDNVHPSKEGAAIMAETAYRAITGDYGGLRLERTFTDNMVIQRNRPVRIRGTADTGDRITVTLAGVTATTVADVRGRWSVTLPPLDAGTGLEMKVSGRKERIVLRNIAAGEVWLCSGQSNMAFQTKNAKSAHEAADDPLLRLFDMKPLWYTDNVEWSAGACDSVNAMHYFADASWEECTRERALEFSAVAYHFGRMLRDSLDVPVGLICNAVGGSTQESWIDRQTLETKLPMILRNWIDNDFTQQWARGRARKNMTAMSGGWLHHPYEPCYLFDTGIRTLGRPEIKGVIWYQGESNEHCPETYGQLFGMFLESWRGWWNDSRLPVYFVQLSSLGRPSWCSMRDTQRRLSETHSDVGMAVSSDAGDPTDVHPRDKKTIGQRLALIALGRQYARGCVFSGPAVRRAERMADGSARVFFSSSEGLATSDGNRPSEFEAAQYDGIFHKAEASIEGNTVTLRCDSVGKINFIRYGWRPYTEGNLINGAGLPASTFRIKVEP